MSGLVSRGMTDRGPTGIWTEAQAAGIVKGEPGDKASRSSDCPWDDAMYQLMPLATPTLTHRAITQLVASGHVQHVITQNEDGLHRRASLPADRLSELHGNAFIELCSSGQDEPESSSSSSSSSSSDSEEETAEEARAAKQAQQAELSTARALRPPGCGALVVRDFVTYHGDTYKRSNPAGRHVTRRACPRCAAAPTEMDGSGTASNGDGRPLGGRGWLLDSVVDFGETPGGPPWGLNPVHNYAAARRHMQLTDLVVVWGSSMTILANYFDPWHARSKWALPPPRGLRLAPPPAPRASGDGGGAGATGKRRRGKTASAAGTSVCRLAMINRGKALDEELAAVRIESDVDEVMRLLLKHLGLPEPPPYEPSTDPLLQMAEQPRAGEPGAPWRIGGDA